MHPDPGSSSTAFVASCKRPIQFTLISLISDALIGRGRASAAHNQIAAVSRASTAPALNKSEPLPLEVTRVADRPNPLISLGAGAPSCYIPPGAWRDRVHKWLACGDINSLAAHMLTLRQIEVIRAIMVTGSVGGAARLLNVSSPGISRVMKHAEALLGLKLFSRKAGRYTRRARQTTSSARSMACTTRSKTCSF